MRLRTYRKIHRWLGIVVGVQLLFWTASGLFFALNPIEMVRGETEQAKPGTLAAKLILESPRMALEELRRTQGEIDVLSVVLRPHLATSVYEISYRRGGSLRWALADGSTGRLRDSVSSDEAAALAMADFAIPAEIMSVERITSTEVDSEYRGRPLPVYRVEFDHPLGTHIYVSADRGVVTARRNDRWRWFDFLWMLHIMDYDERDDFNSSILKTASGLGVITVLSGFVLAGMTSPRLRRLFGGGRSA